MGDELVPLFTLAVRLVTDTEERIRRLKSREYKRFENRVLPDGGMYSQHLDFLEWATAYDVGSPSTRSRQCHDIWQKKLGCRLITMPGNDSVFDNVERIICEGNKQMEE